MNYTSVDISTAKKYAQAFVRVFSQKITFSDCVKIEHAQKILSVRRRILFFLQLPQLDTIARTSMIEDLVDYFLLPHQFLSLFLLLIAHNRSFYIPYVLLFIVQLYKKRSNILDFSVISSHSLTEKQESQIKLFLAHSAGKNIMCSYSVNKNLIAGVRMQSVEYMWEYSVRKQLLCLRALEK